MFERCLIRNCFSTAWNSLLKKCGLISLMKNVGNLKATIEWSRKRFATFEADVLDVDIPPVSSKKRCMMTNMDWLLWRGIGCWRKISFAKNCRGRFVGNNCKTIFCLYGLPFRAQFAH